MKTIEYINRASLKLDRPVHGPRNSRFKQRQFQKAFDAYTAMATNKNSSVTFSVPAAVASDSARREAQRIAAMFRSSYYDWRREWQKKGNSDPGWTTTVHWTESGFEFTVYDPKTAVVV